MARIHQKITTMVLAVMGFAGLFAGCSTSSPGSQSPPPAASSNNPARPKAEVGKSKLLANMGADGFRDEFPVNKADLADSGENPYFILRNGYRLTYEHGKNTLMITVLDETKMVDGVKTRVVEERETKGGRLDEVSRNYFAIDRKTNDVYCFGEETDEYKNGKVVNHEGSWLSGRNGARFGLMMPGVPKPGDKFYQELAPGVAMDRCEIISLGGRMKTPAGEYQDVMCVADSSALESGSERKLYARSVGLLKDGEFVLVKIEKP